MLSLQIVRRLLGNLWTWFSFEDFSSIIYARLKNIKTSFCKAQFSWRISVLKNSVIYLFLEKCSLRVSLFIFLLVKRPESQTLCRKYRTEILKTFRTSSICSEHLDLVYILKLVLFYFNLIRSEIYCRFMYFLLIFLILFINL